ncbi:MAG: hypothetical protein LBE91_07980 [Tannerella sp.]|jgi:hypothetical protein|nr:hypothetical protein [Tannerella sp.]
MIKKLLIFGLIVLLVFVAAEIFLRKYYGFCDTVLMQEDNQIEYIAQPNQNRFRFRKHIRYNEFSMRSESVAENDTSVILGFGDSVLNGGVQTEQDSLATYIIENELNKYTEERFRCLNISAGSWGPDNCFAYLEKYGDFHAKLIFLVVSSHDAHDNMDFQSVIDIDPGFPSKQSKLAISELINRYLLPRLLAKQPESDHIVKGTSFNSGFINLYNYATSKNIPFFIYLHPDRKEVENNQYDEQGMAIIKFCTEQNITLIQGLGIENPSCFRDDIHLNGHGQRVLAEALLVSIKEQIHL